LQTADLAVRALCLELQHDAEFYLRYPAAGYDMLEVIPA